MIVRAYSSPDYYGVFKVYRESFGPEFTERLLKDHLFTSDYVWVAQSDQKDVIGYLLAECNNGVPYLSQVAVDAQCRGTGVATKLIKVFENHYEKQACDSLWLQVKVENPSQKLYFDLGYRVSKFEPNLYGPGKHGLRMDKSLGVTA
jgi:ribosomal protein S18 acetylase RimI-like enzyme